VSKETYYSVKRDLLYAFSLEIEREFCSLRRKRDLLTFYFIPEIDVLTLAYCARFLYTLATH